MSRAWLGLISLAWLKGNNSGGKFSFVCLLAFIFIPLQAQNKQTELYLKTEYALAPTHHLFIISILVILCQTFSMSIFKDKKNSKRAPGGRLCSLRKDNFLPDCINKRKNRCVELLVSVSIQATIQLIVFPQGQASIRALQSTSSLGTFIIS